MQDVTQHPAGIAGDECEDAHAEYVQAMFHADPAPLTANTAVPPRSRPSRRLAISMCLGIGVGVRAPVRTSGRIITSLAAGSNPMSKVSAGGSAF